MGEFFEADLVFQRNRFLVIPLLVALRNQHRWPNEANTRTHTLTRAHTHTHNHNEEAMKMLNIGKMFFIISLSLSPIRIVVDVSAKNAVQKYPLSTTPEWLDCQDVRSRSLKKAGVYFSPEFIEKARMELDTHTHTHICG